MIIRRPGKPDEDLGFPTKPRPYGGDAGIEFPEVYRVEGFTMVLTFADGTEAIFSEAETRKIAHDSGEYVGSIGLSPGVAVVGGEAPGGADDLKAGDAEKGA